MNCRPAFLRRLRAILAISALYLPTSLFAADPGPGKPHNADPGPPPILIFHTTEVTAKSAPDTRSLVGISEVVDFKVFRLGVEVTDNVQWTATDGTPGSASAPKLIWRAPVAPGTATITAAYLGATASATIQYIAPADIKYTKLGNESFPAGVSGAGMGLQGTLLPTTVSFTNLQYREDGTPPANAAVGAQGYFATFQTQFGANSLNHQPNPAPLDITPANDLAGFDHASGSFPPPFAGPGTFSWHIPNQYMSKFGGGWTTFTTVDQVFTLTPINANLATVTVRKRDALVTRP